MFGHHRKATEAPTTDPLTDLSEATPTAVLSLAAWDALRTLRAAGHDVTAYRAGNSSGPWVIWVRPAYGWQEGRFTPAQWQAFYTQWLALTHAAGQLTREYWMFVCQMLGEAQPNGQLVPQEPPRDLDIVTAADVAAGRARMLAESYRRDADFAEREAEREDAAGNPVRAQIYREEAAADRTREAAALARAVAALEAPAEPVAAEEASA